MWGDSLWMVCCLLNSVAWYGGTSSSDCCSFRTASDANLFLWSIASPLVENENSRARAFFPPGGVHRSSDGASRLPQNAYRFAGAPCRRIVGSSPERNGREEALPCGLCVIPFAT